MEFKQYKSSIYIFYTANLFKFIKQLSEQLFFQKTEMNKQELVQVVCAIFDSKYLTILIVNRFGTDVNGFPELNFSAT